MDRYIDNNNYFQHNNIKTLENGLSRVVPYGIHIEYDYLSIRKTATWEGKPMIRNRKYTTFSGNVEYEKEI